LTLTIDDNILFPTTPSQQDNTHDPTTKEISQVYLGRWMPKNVWL